MPTSKRSSKGSAQSAGLLSLQEYLEIPLRRPLLVVGPTIAILAIAIAVAFTLPKRYRSSTLILVESEKVPENFVQRMATDSISKRLQTIRQEVLSRTRLEQVIAEINPYPGNGGGPDPLSAQVERMRRAISIDTKGADAFHIEYEHTEPDKAMKVAGRLATLFIEEAEGQRERQASEGFDFINTQLADTRKNLESKEEAVRRFKERSLGTLPEQMGANLATLQRLQLEQQTLAENMRAAQARSDMLRQALRRNAPSGPGGGEAPTELARLRADLVSLRARYTEEHPDVRATARRIRELEASAASESSADPDQGSARAQLAQAETDLKALEARRADLSAQIARLQGQVDRAPRTEQELTTLTRDYGQLQETYLNLLKRQLEAQMAERLERRWRGERFKILDPAHLPDKHFFPNRGLFAVLGLLAGLGIGVAAAFGAEYLDHSIKNASQLEELVPVPLLAMIPQIPGEGRSSGRR